MLPKLFSSLTSLKHPLDDREYTSLTQDEEKNHFFNLLPPRSENASSRSSSPSSSRTSSKYESMRCSIMQALNSKVPWMLSTALFFCTTLAMLASRTFLGNHGTFESGFSTDFTKMKSAIRLQTVNFTGTTKFAADGTAYIDAQPQAQQYVGEPSKQIDHNWNQLTKNRYFRLTEEEARAAWGDEYPQFWDAEENGGGFTVGLDVFHTLHCLDHIRQRFYPDYYPQTSIHGLKHHEHCINHLRQMVQCYSDATPIPTRFFPGIGHNYVDSNRLHTCRDFGAIRKWTSERFESDGLHDFDDHNGA